MRLYDMKNGLEIKSVFKFCLQLFGSLDLRSEDGAFCVLSDDKLLG